MRLLAFLLLATVLLPVALADMDQSAGPARVRTQTFAYGTGCSGANGGSWQDASVTVAPTANESETAGYQQGCWSWQSGSTSATGHGGALYVTRVSYGSYTGASYSWFTSDYDDGAGTTTRQCADGLSALGAGFALGCVRPAGTPWPALPLP